MSIDDVAASEVVLVTMMPDDSGSIASAHNTAAVRDGHNFVIAALRGSKQAGEVLAHTRYLNGHVLCPYTALDQAVLMTPANYDPNLGTPLFDQTAVLLGTVIAKAQELASAGIAVRTVTLIITDGGDAGSAALQKAADVRALVDDLVAQEQHIVAAMGIDGRLDRLQGRLPRDGHPRSLDPDARQQLDRNSPRLPSLLATGCARVARRRRGRDARRLRELAWRRAACRFAATS